MKIRMILKQSLNEDLRNFNQTAYETKFKQKVFYNSYNYDDKIQ